MQRLPKLRIKDIEKDPIDKETILKSDPNNNDEPNSLYEQLPNQNNLKPMPPTYHKISAGIWTNHTSKTELIALQ